MYALGTSCAKVTQFIKKMRGGSQPILVRANDGLLYVVKFADNLQGPNLLFNESAGTELYRLCGLTVPAWQPLLLDDEFLDHHLGAWIETEQGLQKPAAGLCFGSRYVGAESAGLYEILPSTAFARISNRTELWLSWLVDVCAEHADNRQALFVEETGKRLLSYFIDHGHLFGGAKGDRKTHFTGSRYLDSRIYPQLSSRDLATVVERLGSLDESAVKCRLAAIPDDWKTPSAIQGLERCLNRLADRMLLKNVLDTIVDSVPRRSVNDGFGERYSYKTRTALLRPRIQAPDASCGFGLDRLHRLACGQG